MQNRILGKKNLNSDAARILGHVNHVADAIKDYTTRLHRSSKLHRPLIVWLGEDHDVPPMRLRLLPLLRALKEKRLRTAVTFEIPHNILETAWEQLKGTEVPGSLRELRRGSDRWGRLSLQAPDFLHWGDEAPHTEATVFHYLKSHDIRFQFTDATYDENDFLSVSDRRTRIALEEHFNPEAKPGLTDRLQIEASGPEGVAFRNAFMAAQDRAFAYHADVDVLIQQGGNGHGVGDIEDGYSGSESFGAAVKRIGQPVLVVPGMSSQYTREDMPRNHGLTSQELLILPNLPEWTAFKPTRDSVPDLKSQREEAAYDAGLLSRWGMQEDIFTIEQFEERARDSDRVMQATFTGGPRPR